MLVLNISCIYMYALCASYYLLNTCTDILKSFQGGILLVHLLGGGGGGPFDRGHDTHQTLVAMSKLSHYHTMIQFTINILSINTIIIVNFISKLIILVCFIPTFAHSMQTLKGSN